MPTKNAAAKKPALRRAPSKPKAMRAPVSEPMPGPCCDSAPASSSSRVVYLAGCRNCCHVPLGVNAMLTVLIAIIFTLSAMLMAASVAVASY